MSVHLNKMYKSKWKLLTVLMLPALAACSGGEEVSGGLPGVSNNPPATIRISYPTSNAILDLGGGVYSRRGSVVVTDSEGNAVADGTRIKLIVIDSIKAYGTIDAGDSLSGTTLTDNAPLLGDFVTAATLDGAYADRASALQFIDGSDHVLLFNAFNADRVRQVGARSASNPSNTTLNTTAAYSVVYPNATYDGVTFIPEYVVGSSLLGANIAGEAGTIGYATTSNGVARFNVTYPADVNHINVGCSLAAPDTRHLPVDSAATFVVAMVDGFEHVNVIDSGIVGGVPAKTGFCFSPIRGGEILASQSGANVEGWCKDGGDGVPIPFTTVNVSSSDSVSVDVTSPAITNEYGYFVVPLTGALGNTATITLECNGGATADVDVAL